MAATPNTGVDITLGVGGTPEGVLAACALRALGGAIQAKLWFADDVQRRRAVDAGHDLDRVLATNDLIRSENAFFVCTGITDGELLEGVRYTSTGATTESLVMRAQSGTIRSVHSQHALATLRHRASAT
jgi:fructose-1,6-bisphosphatase II